MNIAPIKALLPKLLSALKEAKSAFNSLEREYGAAYTESDGSVWESPGEALEFILTGLYDTLSFALEAAGLPEKCSELAQVRRKGLGHTDFYAEQLALESPPLRYAERLVEALRATVAEALRTHSEAEGTVDLLEWASWGAEYLYNVRVAREADFRLGQQENTGWTNEVPRGNWRSIPKSIAGHLYHYTLETFGDADVPGSVFSTPQEFDSKITAAKAFLLDMGNGLETALEDARKRFDPPAIPDHISILQQCIRFTVEAIDFVQSRKPTTEKSQHDELLLLEKLIVRFHESVLALRNHPHGGQILRINNEWDCQYLFRAILAAYFADVRREEWNPSVAGSSARCEFFLKDHATMIELKFVRKETDQDKIKGELAKDFVDYGNNPTVDRLFVLIYDPQHQLAAPVQLEKDFSHPRAGLNDVRVRISPPRQ